MTWETHVDYTVKRAHNRLFYYCSVTEYGTALRLTHEQPDSTEYIQARALRIAYPNVDYGETL